jgi:hypothetical protein
MLHDLLSTKPQVPYNLIEDWRPKIADWKRWNLKPEIWHSIVSTIWDWIHEIGWDLQFGICDLTRR